MTKRALNRGPWERMFLDLQIKSLYWYSSKPNGVFISPRARPDSNTMVLFAVDDRCLQVFTFDRFDLLDPWNIQLDGSLIGKTILINVSPYGIDGRRGEVFLNNIGTVYDPWGGNNSQFSSVTRQSMLWNFYGATKVKLGSGSDISFPGSTLIPHGDLEMSGGTQDGRTIVRGDVLHDAERGSFTNYEFDPPCPLPLPPSLNIPSACD